MEIFLGKKVMQEMEEEATHALLLLMDMVHRKSWSYSLRLWEKEVGTVRAPTGLPALPRNTTHSWT